LTDEPKEQTLFCCRCEEFQNFHKLADGRFKCEVCGHVTDEYQAESDYDTQIEENDIF
jgi:uncharacterized protein (DUF983 family)